MRDRLSLFAVLFFLPAHFLFFSRPFSCIVRLFMHGSRGGRERRASEVEKEGWGIVRKHNSARDAHRERRK